MTGSCIVTGICPVFQNINDISSIVLKFYWGNVILWYTHSISNISNALASFLSKIFQNSASKILFDL